MASMAWSSGGEWVVGLEAMTFAEFSELPMANQGEGDFGVERSEATDLGVLPSSETPFSGRQLEELSKIR